MTKIVSRSSMRPGGVRRASLGATIAAAGPRGDARPPNRLVLATDARPSADPALKAAAALARRGASVQVVAVYSPAIPPPHSPNVPILKQCAPSDRREIARLIRRVRHQLKVVLGEAHPLRAWPISTEVGDPGSTVARCAAELDADLIVLGLGDVDRESRRAGTQTAVSTARYAIRPVYAVMSGFEEPTRAVVVTQRDQCHIPTVRAAAGCVGAAGRVTLVELHANAPNSVSEALRLAAVAGAQLIAVTDYGDPGPVRLFLPNIVDEVLLAAPCSVLVVPDRTGLRDAR